MEYTEGSVVIDVVDGRTRELLWRGHGVSVVSDQPSEYVKDLREAVDAILAKWPGRTGRDNPSPGGR
jgi:GTP:adenosylcobinamide-phosphate guanylyltransferase